MPAQSPTLSPTLSAITAGLRGSSSGIPASTLPTRSAPTSAALVKMPPPSRAKTEISEPPKPRPIERVDGLLVAAAGEDEHAVVAGDAEQREADDEQAGDRAAFEGDVERRRHAAAGRLGDAGVGPHREVHADEAGRAGEGAADHEADRGLVVLQEPEHDRDRHRDRGDDHVLAVEVGLGALLHRARDFLHALVARRLLQQALRDDQSVEQLPPRRRRARRRLRIRSRSWSSSVPPAGLAARGL